jgi:3-oxoacyl-(acyl-carrier-protein) synthase
MSMASAANIITAVARDASVSYLLSNSFAVGGLNAVLLLA